MHENGGNSERLSAEGVESVEEDEYNAGYDEAEEPRADTWVAIGSENVICQLETHKKGLNQTQYITNSNQKKDALYRLEVVAQERG